MKTLKQILKEMGYTNGIIDNYQIAVKEWLTQKHQELNPNESARLAGYIEDIAECAKADIIDELLEELKQ